MKLHQLALLGSLLAMVYCVGCASTHATSTKSSSSNATAVTSEFDSLAGETWRGNLTYLDYSSNKLVTIRSTLRVTKVRPGVWTFATGYDDEPQANGASEVRLEDSGSVLNNNDIAERVISRVERGDQVQVTTESAGQDDSRPATIRKTYTVSPAKFSIRKEVKLQGTSEFFMRHEYSWTR